MTEPESQDGRKESVAIPLARRRRRRTPNLRFTPTSNRSTLAAAMRRPLGGLGFVVVALLALIGIFADLLASELPIACVLEGRVYVLPSVVGDRELQALGGAAVHHRATFALHALVHYGPQTVDEPPILLACPGAYGHPFGTDEAGRDVFARVIHGTRSYLVFALSAVFVAIAFAALFGGIAGLSGGTADALVARGVETVSAFPPLVLVIGIQAAVPTPSLGTLFFAIAVTRFPELARLVRGEVVLATTRDYVMAARALGASPLRVLSRHVAPHIHGPLIVASALSMASVVLTEASIDFLGVGRVPNAASWGETMSEFRHAPHAWWLLAFPGLLLFATVVSHNIAAEALRETLDPHVSIPFEGPVPFEGPIPFEGTKGPSSSPT